MDQHFLDERELPWERRETNALHELLKSMYPNKDAAIEALEALGFKNAEADFEFHALMDRSWRKLMNDLHRRQKLADFLTRALGDERLVRYHDELRALMEGGTAGISPETGTASRLDWRGEPIDTAGGFERLLRDGRSLHPADFLGEGARVASGVAWIEARFDGERITRGSGFLVGPDLVLSNHHVLHDEGADWAAAREVEVRLGYEENIHGVRLPYRTVQGLVETIQGEADHDWAVIRLAERPGDAYRWLSLTLEAPIDIAEPVFIAQHPGGRRKVISLDPAGVVRYMDADRIQYLTETEEGSSGAPVFNRRWQVVALHHRWEDVKNAGETENRNQGVRIARVIEGLAAKGIELGGDDSDPEPGLPPGTGALQGLAVRKAALLPDGELPSARWSDDAGPDAEALRQCLADHGRAGRGGFVALLGARGYGKFALARVVLEERGREGASVLATSFVAPPTDAEKQALSALKERWPEASDRAGWAWLDLVAQAEKELARKGIELPSANGADGAAYLRALVRALAADGPVYVLLDELSRAEGAPSAWWQNWLVDLGEQIRATLPCMVVMTLPPAPFGWAAWVDDLLDEVGSLLRLRLELGEIEPGAAERYLSYRLDGTVDRMITDNLRRIADRVPVVFEDLVEWCLEARVPGPDGRPDSVFTFDEAAATWRTATGAGDLVFENAHEVVLAALDHFVPQDDASAWDAARGMMNRLDQPSHAQLRHALKHLLACAALEGRRFTAEFLAATLDMDPERLIDWLDEHLVREDGNGLLEDDGFTELTPAMATVPLPSPSGGGENSRFLHHYRFRWAWQWRTCTKYFLDERDRSRLTVGLIQAIEAQVPTMHRGAFAPAMLSLLALGKDLQSRGYFDGDRDDFWLQRAMEYEILGRYHEFESPALTTLQWHAELLEKRGKQRSPHQDRVLLQVRLALAEALLNALADGTIVDAHLPAEEAERAAKLAAALDSGLSLTRARALDQAARLAGAIARTAPADDTRASIDGLLKAGLVAAADAAGLDATALPDEVRAALAVTLLRILEHREVERDARIAAGLCLGRIGDPRFERRVGPDGEYLFPPLVDIPSGRYPIGSSDDEQSPWFDPDGFPDERDAHELDIDAFSIGRYPVTNAEWACFMEAGGYEDERWWRNPVARAWLAGDPEKQELGRQYWRDWWQKAQEQPDLEGWLEREARAHRWSAYSLRNRRAIARQDARGLEADVHRWYPDRPPHEPDSWRDPSFNNAAQPVVGVSWFEALAYSKWLSAQSGRAFRLPSEVQWEAAARGVAGRRYAFGTIFDPAFANTAESELERTTPVGAHAGGATPEGVDDLCGNVMEWTRSLWGTELNRPELTYPYVADDGREDEEAPAECLRVLRGGSWGGTGIYARAAYRYRSFPTGRFTNYGFRLVCASPISVDAEP